MKEEEHWFKQSIIIHGAIGMKVMASSSEEAVERLNRAVDGGILDGIGTVDLALIMDEGKVYPLGAVEDDSAKRLLFIDVESRLKFNEGVK